MAKRIWFLFYINLMVILLAYVYYYYFSWDVEKKKKIEAKCALLSFNIDLFYVLLSNIQKKKLAVKVTHITCLLWESLSTWYNHYCIMYPLYNDHSVYTINLLLQPLKTCTKIESIHIWIFVFSRIGFCYYWHFKIFFFFTNMFSGSTPDIEYVSGRLCESFIEINFFLFVLN